MLKEPKGERKRSRLQDQAPDVRVPPDVTATRVGMKTVRRTGLWGAHLGSATHELCDSGNSTSLNLSFFLKRKN